MPMRRTKMCGARFPGSGPSTDLSRSGPTDRESWPHAGLGAAVAWRPAVCRHRLDFAAHPGAALLDGPTGPRVLGLGSLDQMKHVLSAAVVPPTEPEVDDRRR